MVKLGGGGNYVKSAEVQNGDVIEFLSEGEWIENQMYKYPDGNPKVDFIMKVKYKDEEKLMRLNATNRKSLVDSYGEETSVWVGKKAKLESMACMVGGKMCKTIIVLPLQESGIEKPKEQIQWDEDK